MSKAYSGTSEAAYAPSCDEIVKGLESVGRKVRKGGVQMVVTGVLIGQNGGLAFPQTDVDRGTVETFREFVQQLGSEGIAEAVETQVSRPIIAIGKHSYLVSEPLTTEDIGQYVRLDLMVTREEGKDGRLRYEANLAHSCRPDKKLKAANGAQTDMDLWVELTRVFVG